MTFASKFFVFLGIVLIGAGMALTHFEISTFMGVVFRWIGVLVLVVAIFFRD